MSYADDSTVLDDAEVVVAEASFGTATFVEPLEEPQAYGGDELLADLRNVSHVEGLGPSIGADLETALQGRNYAAAEDLLGSVKDWFKDHDDRYRVIDDGTTEAQVPLLLAAAPDIPQTSVEIAQEEAKGAGLVTSLKIAGTGLGTSAKIDITDTTTLTCSPGEVLVATIQVPVHWERRADRDNEDYNWLVTQILKGRGSWPITISRLPEMPKVRILSTAQVDARSGGAAPAKISKKYAIETGADFTFGLKIDAIGLDTSLKISAEASMSVSLDATLPSKHNWDVAWLAGPWGAAVTAY